MGYRVFLRIIAILLCCIPCSINDISAQVRPGLKFGVSTPDVQPSDIWVKDYNGADFYHVYVKNARYGVHAGAFLQMQMGAFFLQPEILYNSSSVDYGLETLYSPESDTSIFRDTYKNIDFPLMLGLKAGALRLGGGPVAHLFLGSESGFKAYEEFEELFDDFTWGWQAGVGLDLWKLHFDLRYEGNFSELGDQITFFGKEFDFETQNNRLIASFGLSF